MCTGLKNTKQLKDQYCPYRTKNLHNDKIAMGNLETFYDRMNGKKLQRL